MSQCNRRIGNGVGVAGVVGYFDHCVFGVDVGLVIEVWIGLGRCVFLS